MNTPSTRRRLSVPALITAVAMLAMVMPAVAAGEDRGVEARSHPTINGGPRSRPLHAAITTRRGVDMDIGRAGSVIQVSQLWTLRIRGVGYTPPVTLLQQQQVSSPNRSWVERHPVLFGALVGAVAGAVIVSATVDAEASPLGFYGGAGAGAVVGWVLSRYACETCRSAYY
jgi:hypothetical protein